MDNDLDVPKINLDDSDIFKSAMLEKEPFKASSTMTNALDGAMDKEPVDDEDVDAINIPGERK